MKPHGECRRPAGERRRRWSWVSTSATSPIRSTCRSCGGPSNRAASSCLQQVSLRANAAPGGGLFIESCVAPDMQMRPLWQTLKYLQDGGLKVLGVEAMREHYVRTVEQWIDTFEHNYSQFAAMLGEEVARV